MASDTELGLCHFRMAGRARAAVWLQIATHVHARDGVGLDYTRSEIAKLAALTQTTPTDDIALRVSPEDALIPKAVVGAASEGTSPVALIERRVEFRGNAREYFNIWIVNVALTLLTLGVYSAWAKVRTRRYLYGSVWLVGAPLDYQAKPLPILVGRAIGFVLFLAYVLGGRISPEFGLITPGVIALLAPWLIVRGLRFRARYSAWRGLNFGFAGSVGQSYVVFLLNYLLMPLSLGFAYPYIRAKQRHFVIAQHRFGSQHFAFDATVGDFYPIYLAAWALAFLGYLGLVGVMAVATRGWGVTGVWLALIASYFLYFSAFVYIAARVANLTFNKMRVGAMRFRSNVRARDLAGLYLGNTVAILLTLGLAVPWAVVRMARYRATQLVALVPEDLSGFVADSAVTEGAIGAEVADSFDVGVGI